jgi:MFS family permease
LIPSLQISPIEQERGLKLVTADGLASEAMNSLISGTFLVAMAILLGATNFQIGLLAAIPTFNNIFQLLSIWLVRKYNNRRAICVISSFLGRFCILLTGFSILFSNANLNTVILFLFFYYFFGSIAAPSWNAWMKDLVPESLLGKFFARRTALMQLVNASLSFITAISIDYIKRHSPQLELSAYGMLYLIGGIAGLTGVYILSRTPEPQSILSKENIFSLFKRPLQDRNFLRLLIFNSVWIFAVNLTAPFFSVFMMKSLSLPLSSIIALTIASQLCGILFIRSWGSFADRYSNKTIIAIAAPLYLLCLIAWSFAGIYTTIYANLALLFFIHVFSGIALAGINLSLINIGLKLAPREFSIVYLSVRNMITALFSALAPLLGGFLADFFASRHLNINAQWIGPGGGKTFHLMALTEWNFLFLISALIVFVAIQLLAQVKETGEVERDKVRRILRKRIRSNLKDYFLVGSIISLHDFFRDKIRKKSG